jgi:hypothetical protein
MAEIANGNVVATTPVASAFTESELGKIAKDVSVVAVAVVLAVVVILVLTIVAIVRFIRGYVGGSSPLSPVRGVHSDAFSMPPPDAGMAPLELRV